jgi:uncharacterized integral membrane protein
MNRGPEPQQGRRRGGWRPWALGIAAILVLIIIAQNSQTVPIDFLFIHTTMPLIIALLIAALLGVVIGYFGPLARRGRRD